MKTNRIMMGAIVALAYAILGSPMAHAGWLGPANYDECVLEKTKDFHTQVNTLAYFDIETKIEKTCEQSFPHEHGIARSSVHAEWCGKVDLLSSLCIREQPADYKITNAYLSFSNQCSDFQTPINSQPEPQRGPHDLPDFSYHPDPCPDVITVKGKYSWWKGDFDFDIPARSFSYVWTSYSGVKY